MADFLIKPSGFVNKMSLYNYDLYLNSTGHKLYLDVTGIQEQSENLVLVFQNLWVVLSLRGRDGTEVRSARPEIPSEDRQTLAKILG